jgi:hypothetical protein
MNIEPWNWISTKLLAFSFLSKGNKVHDKEKN